MPFANNWGYVPNDNFKSVRSVIHTLVEIVAKGGNFLLGVGPGPDGLIPLDVVARLEEIGAWMDTNGEAIYGTRAVGHYQDGDVFFTGKGDTLYAIALQPEEESLREITWTVNLPAQREVRLLGYERPLRVKRNGNSMSVALPEDLPEALRNAPALVLAFTTEE